MLTDEGIGPAALARVVEERGFESLFVPEHSHVPVGCEVPLREFRRLLDPFLALPARRTGCEHLVAGVPQGQLVFHHSQRQ
jgi:alkanesulfonate monooxygenase SsuD/methylene tetrahydromethanopterin reductase-like flavin-dependent oxidoreductase (luciferase family)